MNCYVCGFPRPEGAKYCPGCGRYCADDPNVRQASSISPEHIIIEDPVPAEPAVPMDDSLPMEEAVPEMPISPEPLEEAESTPVSEEPHEPVSDSPAPPEVPRKRKKHRPVLIPVLIMAGLFLVGTVCWFAMPYAPVPEDTPVETTEPASQKPPLPSDKREPSGESAEAYEPTDERCFRIKNGIVSFIPERYDGSPILVIPSEIDGQTVTGIAAEGFRALEDVTTLVLPDTLESIGDFAFAHCEKLRGVYIPDSVTSIGEGAFLGCIDMESVSIPEGVATIGADAFDGCASLMYLFYGGTHEQWMALYNEYITPFTFVCCSDGDYYHGVDIP